MRECYHFTRSSFHLTFEPIPILKFTICKRSVLESQAPAVKIKRETEKQGEYIQDVRVSPHCCCKSRLEHGISKQKPGNKLKHLKQIKAHTVPGFFMDEFRFLIELFAPCLSHRCIFQRDKLVSTRHTSKSNAVLLVL